MYIATVCLQKGKSLITASYISPEMRALDEQVKSKDLIFLNELGLDPGIDHLGTMKIINQVEKEGGKILEYESWCGGLPSPDCCDNPLGYKFTWSPIGAFRALNNKAVFINDGK
jgi:saccharopine dehydrogenase-like NADP-dependent oxidoreductase